MFSVISCTSGITKGDGGQLKSVHKRGCGVWNSDKIQFRVYRLSSKLVSDVKNAVLETLVIYNFPAPAHPGPVILSPLTKRMIENDT